MADPNQPKPATTPDASMAAMAWLFLGLRGRISRKPYWLAIAFVMCITAIVAGIWIDSATIELNDDGENILSIPPMSLPLQAVMLLLQWVFMALAVKRSHDRGITGFLGLLTLVPVVSVPFVVAIGLMPGDPGPNKYGPASDSPPARRQRRG